jgi:ABC-type lipoprotein export system ATPase subunit
MSGALELRDVVKHYPSGGDLVRAVDGVSLTVLPGEFVALYGPSGSGKTTLLELAAGVQPPDRGHVLFGGVDVGAMSQGDGARYRRSLGFVFQRFQLHPGVPAVDNAALKLLFDGWTPSDARAQALRWLKRVGLEQRAHHPPERLSMGERQRVAIARALVNEPSLILADEPTASLDTERGRATLELLAGICRERGIAVLLATHDPEAAAFADRVCDLRDGALTERTDHAPTAAAPSSSDPART